MNSIFNYTLKKAMNFSVLLLVINLAACQNHVDKKPAIDPRAAKETKALLNTYFHKQLKKDSIYLKMKSFSYLSEGCINDILAENKGIGLTTPYILDKIQKDTINWSSALIPYARILNKQGMEKIKTGGFSEYQKLRFKDGTGRGYWSMSNPIFSKDYKFAIVNSIFKCGSLCGTSATLLFEKSNGIWHQLKAYCPSVS